MAFSLSDLFSFNPDGSYAPASNFVAPGAGGFDPNTYSQNDQGQVVGWSPSEAARRSLIDQAYANQQKGNNSTTSFANFGQPPQQLGNDVISALASGGIWMPPGSDPSSKNPFIQANRLDDGSIMVMDPRGGAGANPNYYYDSSGKFQKTGVGSKIMSGAQGVMSVAGAAAGFGALGALAGGGALTLPQAAGAASLVPKNLAPDVLGSSPNTPQPSFGQSNMANGFTSSLGGLSSLFSGGQPSGGNMGLSDLFGSGGSGLSGILGSLGGLGNIGTQIIPGLVDANQKSNAGQSMIDFLNGQQSKMDSESATGQKSFMDWLNGQQSNLTNMASQARDSTLGTLNNQQAQIGQLAGQGRDNIMAILNGQQGQIADQAGQAKNGIMDWINSEQGKIDGLYNPGTPEYNLMQQEMDRKDAAAGRNSQFGTRAVDLAGKLAGIKGGLDTQFATGMAGTVGNANSLGANLLNQFATGTSGVMGNAQNLPAQALNQFATGTAGQMANANNLPSQAASQFANNSVPSVGQSFNQPASNTLNFTNGTSRSLADALGVRSGAFNSLLAGLGALNQRSQQPAGASGGGLPQGLGGAGFSGLSNLFNNSFGSNLSDSLTGGLGTGSIPFGSGFNFGNPILDSNGIGSIGSAGGTGIGFGNFGSGLDSFAGTGSSFGFPDVSDVLDWF